MPTKPFETVFKEMLDENPHMPAETLESALVFIQSGEIDEGRLLLREYVSATIGFKELGRRIGKDNENLIRSLSESGNPTATDLFDIIQACIQAEGVNMTGRKSPNDPDILLWFGRAKVENSDFEGAIKAFDKAIGQWKDEPRILLLRGEAYSSIEDFGSARKDFQQAWDFVKERGEKDLMTKALNAIENFLRLETEYLHKKGTLGKRKKFMPDLEQVLEREGILVNEDG